jgi:sulfate adenylyltransferase subunit 1 (EFTu-like GTPase family)
LPPTTGCRLRRVAALRGSRHIVLSVNNDLVDCSEARFREIAAGFAPS